MPIIHDCLEDRARKEDELIIAFFFEKDSDNCRDFTVLKKITLYPSAFNSVGAEMLFPLFVFRFVFQSNSSMRRFPQLLPCPQYIQG